MSAFHPNSDLTAEWGATEQRTSLGAAQDVWYSRLKGDTAMVRMLLSGASLLLMSCNSGQFQADHNRNKSDHSAADTSSPVNAPAMSLLNTTWEFSDDGKPTVITIDKAGDYIENRVDGTHVVHGTYVQKNGKDCFTSAMGDQATSCWTTIPNVKIGATASAKSDQGYTAVFRRVDYRVLQLPS